MTDPESPSAPLLEQVRVVLVRTMYPGNLGGTARAIKNMGLRQLHLVAPGCSPTDSDALRLAAGSHDILEGATIWSDLASAVAGCVEVVAFTARFRSGREPPEPIRELAPSLAATLQQGPIALVFGPEDFGLSNEDLLGTTRYGWIPTAPAQRSLNLAQAVLLACYELFIAFQARLTPAPARERAGADQMLALRGEMQDILMHVGFLNAQNPEHIMNGVFDVLARSALSPRELAIFRGMFRQLRWGLSMDRDPERS